MVKTSLRLYNSSDFSDSAILQLSVLLYDSDKNLLW